MVTGRLVQESDQEPTSVEGGEICYVEEFPYLGSLIADSGRMDTDVQRRVSKGIQGFWSPEKGSLHGQRSDPNHQEEDLPGLCAVSPAVWS